ncbi:MAG: zf-HC2 domain-containing protein [candidate division Zixibacteria bacterium]|nr:zf-HC2 domain-containing protein [candidate division Zixibacteria bacterium]MCK4427011.1 zf-HC2 domain-containing protein [candidate division Zixibacteria bacterium]
MMNCKNIKKNLVLFLENELTEEQRVEIENHLKICPDCSRLLEEFSQLWGDLERPEKIQPSPYFWTRLKQRVIGYEEGKKPVLGWLGGLIGWARPAVAVAVLLICIFLGYSLGNFPQSVNGQPVYQVNERTIALEQFFDSYNLDPLIDLPTGSIEATYLDMISGE